MLITFEGIDGAGKSTQINKLVSYLNSKNREVLTLREPGGTEVAEKIRTILLESRHEISPIGELLLFSASRVELVQQVIRPALAVGKTVILDRFFDSTTAYQGYGRGIDLSLLQSIIDISTCGTVPDITFYLDIEPEEALHRKFEHELLDRMERSGLEFYQHVRRGYLEMISRNKERFVCIDALLPEVTIQGQVIAVLEERFPA